MKRFQKYFDVEDTLPGYVEGQYSYGSKFVLTESWNDYLQGSEFTLTDNEIPDKTVLSNYSPKLNYFRVM